MRQILFVIILLMSVSSWATAAPSSDKTTAAVSEPENIFATHFFMTPDHRLLHETLEVRGFAFIETPNASKNTRYSIITQFGGSAVRSQLVPDLNDFSSVRKWIDDSLETATFENVEIRKLTISSDELTKKELYFVGNRAYPIADEAKAEIALIQAYVEANNGDFTKMVKDVQSAFYRTPEPVEEPIIVKSPSQQQKEEELFLKYLDAMHIGDKLFGPFQGESPGEPVVWQSFGEITWRKTNLSATDYQKPVGFATNRLLFKGFKAPLNTIDPFIEMTASMDASGTDFASAAFFTAGLEWRPFERMAYFDNFTPYGIPLLKWVKSYRFSVEYVDRKNIKDPIENSDSHNLIAGVSIFYEYGIELPPLNQAPPETVADYVQQYVWGEYFGAATYNMTGFSAEEDVDDFTLTTAVIAGLKTPEIPLPANPLINKIVLFPYMRFEHTTSSKFSFAFQNQYIVSAGIRWLPFRDYRWKDNEWLSKAKLFAEYVGVGKTHHTKQDGSEAPHAIRNDLRFGLSVSSNRF